MTDRELLELAAKAAGFSSPYEAMQSIGKPVSLYSEWNPLNDDGDALRLAVKLGIDISNAQMTYYDKHSKYPYAATRRAIVMSAAEIGKELQ